MYKQVTMIKHPLIEHKMTIIRDVQTANNYFRGLVKEVSQLMVYEVTKHLSLTTKEVQTPVTNMQGKVIENDVLIIPIMRAGLGMLDAFTDMLPQADIGHIGLVRDEKTLQPSSYIVKLPKIKPTTEVFILDPMLATGGSLVKAIDMIKAKGAKKITYVGLVAVQEGIDKTLEEHPDVKIYITSIDEQLTAHGFISPGLGDCGDRLYGKED
jgi:uracil phosphoribosyltransferase